MKAFWLGFLHVALGGAIVPILNAVAAGHFSGTAIAMGAASGAAASGLAYLTQSPAQQTK